MGVVFMDDNELFKVVILKNECIYHANFLFYTNGKNIMIPLNLNKDFDKSCFKHIIDYTLNQKVDNDTNYVKLFLSAIEIANNYPSMIIEPINIPNMDKIHVIKLQYQEIDKLQIIYKVLIDTNKLDELIPKIYNIYNCNKYPLNTDFLYKFTNDLSKLVLIIR